MRGFVALRAARARASVARRLAKNGASRCTWQSRKSSGSVRESTMRFSSA